MMQQAKNYRFLFPIHDQEFEWIEKGFQQGIEQGIEQGELRHAMSLLSRLNPQRAAELADCTDLAVFDDAIQDELRIRGALNEPS
jgi:hypothetical protein